MKVNPIRDTDFRRQWSAEHNHCQVCWAEPLALQFGHLETHHLMTGRSDEACNLLRVCVLCHLSIHAGRVEFPLSRWEAIEVKRLAEPDEFDAARLAALQWGVNATPEAILDRSEPVPEWVLVARDRNEGAT